MQMLTYKIRDDLPPAEFKFKMPSGITGQCWKCGKVGEVCMYDFGMKAGTARLIDAESMISRANLCEDCAPKNQVKTLQDMRLPDEYDPPEVSKLSIPEVEPRVDKSFIEKLIKLAIVYGSDLTEIQMLIKGINEVQNLGLEIPRDFYKEYPEVLGS